MQRNIIIGVILLVGLTVLLIGGNNTVVNQRVDPQIAINQKNMNFESRLKTMSTNNLETTSTKFSKLETKQILAPTDENSPAVQTGDNITVNYVGWLAKDGTVFDQSFNHGDTGFTFTVGQGVIQGWSEGVVGMKVGEVRELKIPYNLAYGTSGSGPIPANADLFFYVELISIN